MMQTEKVQRTSSPAARQRCIERLCDATFALSERLYVCPRCGGLLEIAQDWPTDPRELLMAWSLRLASFNPRDQSGVWRYRELLPFADDAPIVTLAEGNTPRYDAPRSAAYAGL